MREIPAFGIPSHLTEKIWEIFKFTSITRNNQINVLKCKTQNLEKTKIDISYLWARRQESAEGKQ